MKTNLSLSQMAKELERRQAAKADYVANTSALMMTNDSMVSVPTPVGGMAALLPATDIAHTQIAERIGVPTKYYNKMRREAPELLAKNVNHWFQENPETRMVRTLDGHVRAFLSDRYNRIENEEIAGAALPVLMTQEGINIASCDVTETHMYIKAVSTKVTGEVKKGDVVQFGVSISNSEIGLGAVKIQPLVFRLVCQNGLIIPDSKAQYSIRHLGGKLAEEETIRAMLTDETKEQDDRAVLLKIRDVLAASFSQARFEAELSKMQDSARNEIKGNPAETVKLLAKKAGLSEFEEGGVLRHLISGGDITQWGVINAITETSKDVESYDRATELETLGGVVLNMKRSEWEAYAIAA